MTRRPYSIFVMLVLVLWPLAWAAQPPRVDPPVMEQIRTEAYQHSQVMQYAFFLTDVYGPRLMGSPNYRAAGEWAIDRLQELGLSHVQREPLPSFGRGWSCRRFAVHLLQPSYAPLIGAPLAYSSRTNGPVVSEPVRVPLPPHSTEAEFQTLVDRFRGQLKGKIILTDPPRTLSLHTAPPARRWTDQELTALSDPAPAAPTLPAPTAAPHPDAREAQRVQAKTLQFLMEEGVAVWITTGGAINDGGTLTVTHALRDHPNDRRPLPPMVVLAAEHYNRVIRLLEAKIPVRLEVEIDTEFYEDTPDAFNVLAEIPGGKKRAEVVLLGAHLDSWTGGTGATDNAAGCAILIEVVRILTRLHQPLDRTVRIALWTAEEGGGFGSRLYVSNHLVDFKTRTLKPGHAQLSAYFNLDTGAGKIRGIHLQGNESARALLQTWLSAVRDLGASGLSLQSSMGSDQVSFDQVGLSAFSFLQDPLEYKTRTYHTNMDVYDRLQREDLMQAAAVIAALAYQAAMSEEMVPRKALPSVRRYRKGSATRL